MELIVVLVILAILAALLIPALTGYIDKARKKYCFYYTNTEFGFADYYDVCLSTSSLGIETCEDIILKLAKDGE